MPWAPDYVTTLELRSYLRIDEADDDPELLNAIAAASRDIDHHTSRQFGNTGTAQTREYDVRWSRRRGVYIAVIDDVQDLTGFDVVVSGASLASTSYKLQPANAPDDSKPYESIWTDSATQPTLGTGPLTIEITAVFGWNAIPEGVKNACLLQADRRFHRRDAPFGVAGSPELGSETRLLAKLDPDVEVALRYFRRDYPRL